MTTSASSGAEHAYESPTVAWERLLSRVNAFKSAWKAADTPPDLSEYLGEYPTQHRFIALVELIKADMEERWNRGVPKPLEAYGNEFPELADDIPCDLIYEELRIRASAGESVKLTEYTERFPTQSLALSNLVKADARTLERGMIKIGSPTVSSQLSGMTPDQRLRPGDQIEDFDLLTELGHGAFATVFLARQRSMQRLVALKVSANRGDEAQTLAQLDHPYIVRVYDQRLLPDRELRLLYMQYVQAGTLEAVIETTRTIPVHDRDGATLLSAIDKRLSDAGESSPAMSGPRKQLAAANWGETVCWFGVRLAEALAYAHSQGVLHRDVKPANVLIAADGTPKLADFNIATSSKIDGATPAAYFGGSLPYMSPEQLEASNVNHPRSPESLDRRSDIYSLGIVLWEMLVGVRPFVHQSFESDWVHTLERMTAERHAGADPTAFNDIRDHVPAGLETALLKALEPDPEERHQSAREFARQVRLCLMPDVQRLLQPPPNDPWRVMRQHPVAAVIVAPVLANGLLSIMNIIYNNYGIVRYLTPAARGVFTGIDLGVFNAVLYSIALVLGISWYWPFLRALLRMNRGKNVDTDSMPTARRRGLLGGHVVAVISLALWLCSAFALPVMIMVLTSSGAGITAWHWIHFVISQALCGTLAATLCFFAITRVTTRSLYPSLLRPDSNHESDIRDLAWLRGVLWVYFALAAAVPIIAMTALTVIDMTALPQDDMRIASVVLGVVGLASGACAFWLLRGIQRDCDALGLALGDEDI